MAPLFLKLAMLAGILLLNAPNCEAWARRRRCGDKTKRKPRPCKDKPYWKVFESVGVGAVAPVTVAPVTGSETCDSSRQSCQLNLLATLAAAEKYIQGVNENIGVKVGDVFNAQRKSCSDTFSTKKCSVNKLLQQQRRLIRKVFAEFAKEVDEKFKEAITNEMEYNTENTKKDNKMNKKKDTKKQKKSSEELLDEMEDELEDDEEEIIDMIRNV